jgi:hypothetical protein
MKLKTLEQHNLEVIKLIAKVHNPKPTKNGIACPKCGKELYDNYNGFVYTSNPPQVGISCVCGFTGTRF